MTLILRSFYKIRRIPPIYAVGLASGIGCTNEGPAIWHERGAPSDDSTNLARVSAAPQAVPFLSSPSHVLGAIGGLLCPGARRAVAGAAGTRPRDPRRIQLSVGRGHLRSR